MRSLCILIILIGSILSEAAPNALAAEKPSANRSSAAKTSAEKEDMRRAIEALEQKDFNKAVALVRPHAQSGNPFAQWLLGDMYANGEGMPKDIRLALDWWTKAALQGLSDAQLSLGDSYAAGQGVAEDWSEAVKWWRKAADQNLSRAQTGLGLALYSGRGVQENTAEAAKWFQKAADAGDVQSQVMLSRMYAFGEGELKQSFEQAYKWLLIAGDAGSQLADQVMTKGMLDAALRPTERRDAKRLAEQWKFERGKVKNAPPPPVRDEDVPLSYFINATQLSAKCSSSTEADLAWCDAYIAGVVDTLGGRRQLDSDAKDVRLCFQEKRLSNRGAREAVNKALALSLEDKSSPISKTPAVGNVVAGILVYFCK